jgi:hypothetical protein
MTARRSRREEKLPRYVETGSASYQSEYLVPSSAVASEPLLMS